MAYWWVSQNKTYQLESAGQYLWAPLDRIFHHASLDRVRPGDLIFSCVKGEIVAIITPKKAAAIAPRPDGYKGEGDGRRIEAHYQPLKDRIRLAELDQKALKELSVQSAQHAPLNTYFSPNQSYLCPVAEKAAHNILALIDLASPGVVEQTIERSVTETEREVIGKARVGQGLFRERLMAFWNRRCAVSGLSIECLLRASHIKAWRDSNNQERLDRYNGLLLGVGYDAAFDAGLISFAADGRLLVSPSLDRDNFQRLGLQEDARLSRVEDSHRAYLEHHRKIAAFER